MTFSLLCFFCSVWLTSLEDTLFSEEETEGLWSCRRGEEGGQSFWVEEGKPRLRGAVWEKNLYSIKKGKIEYTQSLTFMKWMHFFFFKVWYQKRILWGMVMCAINSSTGESESSVFLCIKGSLDRSVHIRTIRTTFSNTISKENVSFSSKYLFFVT